MLCSMCVFLFCFALFSHRVSDFSQTFWDLIKEYKEWKKKKKYIIDLLFTKSEHNICDLSQKGNI